MKLTPTLLAALACSVFAVGCGGSPGPTQGGELTPSQRIARISLIKNNQKLNDLELAHLCPGLYPSDVLSNPKRYGFDKQKSKPTTWTDSQLKAAAAARCGKPTAITTTPAKKPQQSTTSTPAKP